MAVGTPEELERSISGKKTEIQLDQVNDAIIATLKRLPLGNIAADGNKLIINVTNPEKENPIIVNAIVRAGGHIQSVIVVGSTLEDAYLKLVKQIK
jgi:ABC-2 type transport system ATP-binding protein